MFAFFNDLYINLNVVIEKRKNFDATNREIISVQNFDLFDVAINEKIDNTFFERSRTISNVKIEKNKNFDDEKNDEMID